MARNPTVHMRTIRRILRKMRSAAELLDVRDRGFIESADDAVRLRLRLRMRSAQVRPLALEKARPRLGENSSAARNCEEERLLGDRFVMAEQRVRVTKGSTLGNAARCSREPSCASSRGAT